MKMEKAYGPGIQAFGYDERSGELVIQWPRMTVRYPVGIEQFWLLQNAPDKTAFVNKKIKPYLPVRKD